MFQKALLLVCSRAAGVLTVPFEVLHFFCCSLECSSQVIFNPSAASEVTAASLRVFTSCGVCLRQQKTFTTRISEESRKQEMYSVTLHIVGQYKTWESFVCASPV